MSRVLSLRVLLPVVVVLIVVALNVPLSSSVGMTLSRLPFANQLDLPVPAVAIPEGTVIHASSIDALITMRRYIVTQVPAEAIVRRDDLLDKIVTKNLSRDEPILGDHVDSWRWVPVLSRSVPADELVPENAVTSRRMALSALPAGVLLDKRDLTPRIALKTLAPRTPLTTEDVGKYVLAAGLSRSIPAGTEIAPGMTTIISVSIAKVDDTTLMLDTDLVGRLALVPIPAGRPVKRGEVADYLLVPVPKRVIPVGDKLDPGDFAPMAIEAGRITPETYLHKEDIVGPGKSPTVTVLLSPGQPVTREMVRQQ